MGDNLSRRTVLTAGALTTVAGATYFVTASDDESSCPDDLPNRIDWDGQRGAEHADQDCEDGEEGYWHWVLTPDGPDPIEAAQLTVVFADGDEETVDGERRGRGRGRGAIHFTISRSTGGEIVDAYACYSGGGEADPVVTISEGACVPADQPIVVTIDVENVNESTATLLGELVSTGTFDEVEVYFQWREVGEDVWRETTSQTLEEPGAFDVEIEGLEASREYEFRAVARGVDTEATVEGVILTFEKPDPEDPEVLTLRADDVNESTATLVGELTSVGEFGAVDVFFEWREVDTDSWTETPRQQLVEPGDFDAEIEGLDAGREYEFRAVAVGENDRTVTVIGTILTFEKPDPERLYWQLDFGEGAEPPIPPQYYPDDGFFALGNSEDGVIENPSHARTRTDGQLGDVTIEDRAFTFDDSDGPDEATITFTIDDAGATRHLHLAVFILPGPFDPDEVDEQELYEYTSAEFTGGEQGSLTVSIPRP